MSRAAPSVVPWLALAAALTASTSTWAAPALSAEAVADRLSQGNAALLQWQLDDAAAIAAELDAALPDVPPVQALLGAVKFHQGDYDGAVKLLRRAAEGGEASALLPLAESTLKETADSVSLESKHFVVRVPAGKDEVLLPIAAAALEDAFARITAVFDYVPRHKIAVDVLHDAKGLAQVSSLTEKEIETSGTIALCKYNRLMITSPKALARGYSWLDTLSHEFLHLIISEKSHNAVPVWLHEGLAKYNETRWRGPPGLALDAASENLLATGVKNNKLITFEQMHPSMAKLPSQEDTALAFAEVFTVIEFIENTVPDRPKSEGGKRAINVLLEALRDRDDMDAALVAATGRDLAGLQRDWRAYLKKRAFKLVPGAEPKHLTFVKNARGGGSSVDETEDEATLREAATRGAEARRFVRLGNLLRERRRLKAAAVEYERATTAMASPSPALFNRWASVLQEAGDFAKAKEVLDRTVAVFPDDPQTRVLLGRTAFRAEDWQKAREHYERATWENPFIPEVHVALASIAEKTMDEALGARAERALALLSGHQKKTQATMFFAADDEEAGVVAVRTEPWGNLFIDGVDTNRMTPQIDLRLKPGRHFVRVQDPVSGRVDGVVVDVVAGKSANVNLTLRALTEEQRRSLFAAEAAVLPKPAKPPPKATPSTKAAPTAPWQLDDDDGEFGVDDDVGDLAPVGGPVPVPVPVPVPGLNPP